MNLKEAMKNEKSTEECIQIKKVFKFDSKFYKCLNSKRINS